MNRNINFIKRKHWLLISAVSAGSILEWYEIGLFIYWPMIILSNAHKGQTFLSDALMPITDIINVSLVFATGLIARPLGGIIFGNWGDRRGRKLPFSFSVFFAALPSILVGFLPSYVMWSSISLVIFTAVKFLQGIPAGGEMPGAICYLYENGEEKKRKYLTSFTFVGPQLGLLLSLIVCFSMKLIFSSEALMSTWWRIIFFISGALGFLGFFLRKKLHESYDYQHRTSHHEAEESPIKLLLKNHKKTVVLGILLSIFQVIAFCVLTILPSRFYETVFKLNLYENLFINSCTLLLCIILPPVFGNLSSKYPKMPFLNISALGVLLFSIPFLFSIASYSLFLTLMLQFCLIFFYTLQSALLPYLIAKIFPLSLRYIGIGFSFNLVDGIFWGLIPVLSTILSGTIKNLEIFILLLPIASLIFLISLGYAHRCMHKTSGDF